VLAFKIENNVETFLYMVPARPISDGGVGLLNYRVRLQESAGYKQRLVLIANARSQIDQLISSRPDRWVGQEKEEMLQNLTFDLTGRWITDPNSQDYSPIPMWSEIADPITVEGGVAISDIIPMMRMTAKIEVVVSSEAALAAVPFTLTSVRLYNTNRRGRIVPKSNDIYIDNFKAVRPSLPDNINRVRGPIIYSGTAASPGDFSQGEFGVDMPRAIYLFETAAQTDRLGTNRYCSGRNTRYIYHANILPH
jgi:hypothetical protein